LAPHNAPKLSCSFHLFESILLVLVIYIGCLFTIRCYLDSAVNIGQPIPADTEPSQENEIPGDDAAGDFPKPGGMLKNGDCPVYVARVPVILLAEMFGGTGTVPIFQHPAGIGIKLEKISRCELDIPA
jgi:hypothetical protein